MNVLRNAFVVGSKSTVQRVLNQTFPIMFSSSSTNPSVSAVPANLLKLGKLNHVAIATPNLDQATAMYR